MSWDTMMRGIDGVLEGDAGGHKDAVRTAELIRQAVGYRWGGLHEVTDWQIAPSAPARSSQGHRDGQ